MKKKCGWHRSRKLGGPRSAPGKKYDPAQKARCNHHVCEYPEDAGKMSSGTSRKKCKLLTIKESRCEHQQARF